MLVLLQNLSKFLLCTCTCHIIIYSQYDLAMAKIKKK
jgi:hypothetical protein